MNSISEDQVVSLMAGLRERERNALRNLARDVEAGLFAPQQSARVYRFDKMETRVTSHQDGAGEVVSLSETRTALNAARTKHGFFVYATDAPQPA